MNIAILTQEDPFVIPHNVKKIIRIPNIEVRLAAIIDSPGSLMNRKITFLRGFGWIQSARMGLRLLRAKSLDWLDAAFGFRLLSQKRSVEAVARAHNVPFTRTRDPNGQAFCKRLAALDLDLIVSLSAPCKFAAELLAIPRRGCINLHCSLLPRYAGLMPSFWVLYHGETTAGATVHYMDDEIDNGAILGQTQVPVDPGMTIFELIRKTKQCGGDLLTTVLQNIQAGHAEATANDRATRTWFSWPKIGQMKEFRKRGGRLI